MSEVERPPTDEVLADGKREPELDTRMFFGCALFTLACVLQLFAVVIPFLLRDPLMTMEAVGAAAIVAFGAGLALGALMVLLGGFIGLLGSIAGTLPPCVYLFLRLREAALGLPQGERIVQAEYTEAFAWLLPLMYCIGAALLWSLLFAVRERLSARRR